MTNPTPRDSAQPLRDLTDDEKQLLHYNPNTSDLVEFVQAYAREALRAQAASVEPVGTLIKTYPWGGNGAYQVEVKWVEGKRPEVGTKLYAGAPPAHISGEVEAMNAKQYQRILGLKAALAEVLEFQSAPTTPTIHGYGRWRRLHDSSPPQAVAASSPATAVDARFDVRSILLEVVPGRDGMGVEVYAQTVDDVVRKLTWLDEKVEDAALQASRQPQAQQGGGAVDYRRDDEVKGALA